MNLRNNQYELVLVCRQLSVMLKSGIPLSEAITIIARQGSNSGLSLEMNRALQIVIKNLQSGNSFSSSLTLTKDVFPKYMIAAITAGEAGGILQEILDRQADAIGRSYQSKEKLKTAMLYPVFLLAAASIVAGIMILVVLPVFDNLFREMHASLPLLTRCILGIADIVKQYAGLILIIIFVTVYCIKYFLENKEHRIRFHQLLLNIPVIGRLLHRIDMQCWLDILGLLLKGGVSLVDGLVISTDVLENTYLKLRLFGMTAQIKKGSNLSEAGRRSNCMNGFILEMIAAGEISGELPQMLFEAARLCQIESDNLLERLQVMIEPTIILIIGIVTGLLVISILLPVMDLMTLYI